MARFALIKDGKVDHVIVAEPGFFARADPAWLARWTEIREVVRPGEAAAGPGAVTTRDAEPGAAYDADRKTFTRAAPAEAPKSIEDRIAALESAKVR